jgi:glycosyltransferase involved in cell wall biosynthesis
MRILLLCDRYPWPLTNGQNLRIYHYVRRLRTRHTFDLGCYAEGPPPPEVAELFGRIVVWPKPAFTPARGLARLTDAVRVSRFIPASPEAVAFLGDRANLLGYDLVWVSGWDLIVNVPLGVGPPVLADAVDDGVLEYCRELRVVRGFVRRLRLLKRIALNAAVERRYLGRADQVIFVSDRDSAVFARVSPGTPVTTVNNGVDEQFFRPLETTPARNEIVFEGNIGFAPNADGLLYFARTIFPRILERRPDVRFSIVGRDPPAEIAALASDRIRVTGFVDDVRPFVDAASVIVCPLRMGAGIKNKVLQAWAMAKPVVATTASIGGLRVEPDRNILVRDDPDEFAAAVIGLLDDPARAREVGLAARQTVLDHYTWDGSARQLEAVMERTAARRRTGDRVADGGSPVARTNLPS